MSESVPNTSGRTRRGHRRWQKSRSSGSDGAQIAASRERVAQPEKPSVEAILRAQFVQSLMERVTVVSPISEAAMQRSAFRSLWLRVVV